MSEQEKTSGGGAGGSLVVFIEQSPASRHKQPFRPTELQEEAAELHHKHSKAPVVPSALSEELKDKDATNVEEQERRESEGAMSSEKHKQAAKKLSNKRRSSSPEAITTATIEMETKVGSMTPPTQPIPAQISEASISEVFPEKTASNKKEDDDSITEEITEDITELRTPEIAQKSDWREEEETGGLPCSESRASRAARAVRQLLCCGVRLEAPSEHRISPRPFEGI